MARVRATEILIGCRESFIFEAKGAERHRNVFTIATVHGLFPSFIRGAREAIVFVVAAINGSVERGVCARSVELVGTLRRFIGKFVELILQIVAGLCNLFLGYLVVYEAPCLFIRGRLGLLVDLGEDGQAPSHIDVVFEESVLILRRCVEGLELVKLGRVEVPVILLESPAAVAEEAVDALKAQFLVMVIPAVPRFENTAQFVGGMARKFVRTMRKGAHVTVAALGRVEPILADLSLVPGSLLSQLNISLGHWNEISRLLLLVDDLREALSIILC